MKKIFSLVLVLALTLALGIPALAAEADETAVPEITLSADAEKVPAGKTVTLTLSLTGELKDINSFEYYIRYDPAVVELAESKAGAASNLTKIGTPPEANYKTGEGDTSKAVTVSAVKLADTGVFSMTEGTVAELTFTVKADAATGASAGFTLEKVAVCDKTFVNDAVKVQTGAAPKVTVGSAVVLGDVNGDGKVNNIDAALVYGYHNKKLTLTEDQLAAADVNGDGKVNNMDAALIYAYHNKKLPKFPAA